MNWEDNNTQNIEEKIEEFIKQHLKLQAAVKKASKLKDKVYVVEIEKFENKLEIMKVKSKLKGVGNGNIYINSDLTKKERRIQRKIKEIADREKKENSLVKIGYQKIVNGIKWVWNNKFTKIRKN